MKTDKNLKFLKPLAILALTVWLPLYSFAAPDPAVASEFSESQRITWFEGAVRKEAFQSEDEFAVLAKPGKQARMEGPALTGQLGPRAVVQSRKSAVTVYRLSETMDRQALQRHVRSMAKPSDAHSISPVFYMTTSKDDKARMLLTGEIIVRLPDNMAMADIAQLEKTHGLEQVKQLPYAPNTFLFRAADALSSLEIANRIHNDGEALYAYPNWLRTRVKKFIPDDTLFSDQWHLRNTGQSGGTAGEDVNIENAWDTYTGSTDEVIAIVDDGLEIGHEDLAPNVVAGVSYDYVGGDGNPSPGAGDNHGTACAGVAAAAGNNDQGVSGAAFSAGLVGFRLLGNETDANEANALTRADDVVDIYSNSWGPPDTGYLEGPGPLTRDALAYGAALGRNGLGSIYVWAGGNGYDIFDDSNTDGYANSRYTIAVAASDENGEQSWYSETGANILVNAPSSGGTAAAPGPGITTTDRTGTAGYNSETSDPDDNAVDSSDYDAGDYTNTFSGTSSATPLVAGIVALMLEANENLTWRDVQHILMTTAERNHSGDGDWTQNDASYWVNHKYGFGRVDAQAASTAAASWPTADPEVMTPQFSSSPGVAIPDDNLTGVTDTINVPGTYDIDVESVEVCFSATDHPFWSDLEIVLTAPSGTQSILARRKGTAPIGNQRYNDWCFTSMRHFGETGQGNWTLQVSDRADEDTGTFQSWSLRMYGTTDTVHTITAEADSGGTIVPVGNVAVGAGWDQTFTIRANRNYRIANVVVNGTSVGSQSTYTIENVTDNNNTISATFERTSSGGGSSGSSGGCFIQTLVPLKR